MLNILTVISQAKNNFFIFVNKQARYALDSFNVLCLIVLALASGGRSIFQVTNMALGGSSTFSNFFKVLVHDNDTYSFRPLNGLLGYSKRPCIYLLPSESPINSSIQYHQLLCLPCLMVDLSVQHHH